jgi:hypothetical protein
MRSQVGAIILGLAVPALLALPGSAAAQHRVPFRGGFAGTFAIAGGLPVVTVNSSAAGTATHLGRFQAAGRHQVNLVNDPQAILGGTFTLTAANGDRVFGQYRGRFTPTPRTPVDGLYLLTGGRFTIRGGTGRWNGARGGGDAQGWVLFHAGTYELTLDGVISPPGANGR